MLAHTGHGVFDELRPDDGIALAGATIVDEKVVGLAGSSAPGGGNHQVNHNIDRYHIGHIVLLAHHRAEHALGQRRDQASWPIEVVHPAGERLIQTGSHCGIQNC